MFIGSIAVNTFRSPCKDCKRHVLLQGRRFGELPVADHAVDE